MYKYTKYIIIFIVIFLLGILTHNETFAQENKKISSKIVPSQIKLNTAIISPEQNEETTFKNLNFKFVANIIQNKSANGYLITLDNKLSLTHKNSNKLLIYNLQNKNSKNTPLQPIFLSQNPKNVNLSSLNFQQQNNINYVDIHFLLTQDLKSTAVGKPLQQELISPKLIIQPLLTWSLFLLITFLIYKSRGKWQRQSNFNIVLKSSGIILGALILTLSFYTVVSASDPPQITLQTGSTFFSPNGDGQEDTATVYYCLSQPANVDIWITNNSGTTVRTLESGVSHNYGCMDGIGNKNNWLNWDGKNTTYTMSPDGVYNVHIKAQNNNGESTETSVQLGIDSSTPGTLTSPKDSETLSGKINWTFTPHTGYDTTMVMVHCYGGWFGSSSTPNGDKTFSGSGDTNICTAGINNLITYVVWRDQFHTQHTWYSSGITVTINNPPKITMDTNDHKYFSPNNDTQDDTITVNYCLSQAATLDITISNSLGEIVRTMQTGVSHYADYSCSFYNDTYSQAITWDGNNDSGQLVDNGQYTVKIHALNASGLSADESLQVGVDVRKPGTLTSPAADALLTDKINWEFTPTEDFNLGTVSTYCNGAYLGSSSGYYSGQSNIPSAISGSPSITLTPSGTQDPPERNFAGLADVADCMIGKNNIKVFAGWVDEFQQYHSWSAPSVPVFIRTTDDPVSVKISTIQRYFSPNGDGQEDEFYINYFLSQNAAVTIDILDSSDTIIRTIESSKLHDITNCYDICSQYVNWDGKNNSGQVVAEGVYTGKISAQNTNGSANASVKIGIDKRLPGMLTFPTENATISANLNWKFVPTSGFTLNAITTSCIGTNYQTSTGTAGFDGVFTGSLDTAYCKNGYNMIKSSVNWLDPFEQGHSWSSSGVQVTVQNAAKITLNTNSTYFSPNDDGQEDEVQIYYNLTQDANVTIAIANSTGSIIRTIANDFPHYAGYNSFSWNGKNDSGEVAPYGVYKAHLIAKNDSGTSPEVTLNLGIDRRIPGVLTSPKSGDTLSGLTTFVFEPTMGFTPEQVYLSFDTGGSANIYNASFDGKWRTSMYTGSLKEGPAKLSVYVYYRDALDGNHYWKALEVPVVIDVKSLPLKVSANALSGQAPFTSKFSLTTSEPNEKMVHYTIEFGDDTATVGGIINPPYEQVNASHIYKNSGKYRAILTVTNDTGAASTRSIDINITAPSNTPPSASLHVNTNSGILPLPVNATIDGADSEHDLLTYKLDFGDGSELNTGSLPHDHIEHTYSQAGTYTMRLSVTDGKMIASKSQTIIVASPEALSANAGNDQAMIVGETITLDGSGSRPSAGITSYHWTFEDGSSADGAVVEHIFTNPGEYTAGLAVTSGNETKTDTTRISVQPGPTQQGLHITVKDESGKTLKGASVVVKDSDGKYHQAPKTIDDGTTAIRTLPDGTYRVSAVKLPGYKTASMPVVIAEGKGSVTIILKAGEVITSSLTSKRMTRDEIASKGIDPDDPDNKHVFEFTVNLGFKITGCVSSKGFPCGITVNGTPYRCFSSCSFPYPGSGGSGGGDNISNRGVVTMTVGGDEEHPQLLWLIIPGKASWLKEFFDVQMLITNLADDPDFTIENGTATLSLPNGLSLPLLFNEQQRISQQLPSIPGGESRSAEWVVRGDTEGEYDLTAFYSGTLEPFGDTVSIEARTQEKLKVWGASALHLTADVDDTVWKYYPYHVTFSLKNIADIPIYYANIEFLKKGSLNYIYEPKAVLKKSVLELNPGETLANSVVLVPDITGDLQLNDSFITKTGGDVTIPSTITQHPPIHTRDTTPKMEIKRYGDNATIEWQAIPDAVGYEVYKTTGPTVDFSNQPLYTVDSSYTSLNLGIAEDVKDMWYTVRTLFQNRGEMIHPLVRASLGADYYENSCGNEGHWKGFLWGAQSVIQTPANCSTLLTPTEVTWTAGSDDGPVQITVSGTADTSGCHYVTGPAAVSSFTCNLKPDGKNTTLVITAADKRGSSVRHYTVRNHLGDTNGDGHVRIAVLGDSFISGEGASTNDNKYLKGTDDDPLYFTGDVNLCHKTTNSWPFIIAKKLGLDKFPNDYQLFWKADNLASSGNADEILFAACSGARTYNVTDNITGIDMKVDKGQYNEPKQIKQFDDFKPETVDIVFVSLGGNDAEFSNVIKQCVSPWIIQQILKSGVLYESSSFKEMLSHLTLSSCDKDINWQKNLTDFTSNEVYNRLLKTFRTIRERTKRDKDKYAEIYAIDYPDPINPPTEPKLFTSCFNPLTLGLSKSEQEWLHNDFLPNLNNAVKRAADGSGIHYLPVQNEFINHQLCSISSNVNEIVGGSDNGIFDIGIIGNESAHPNFFGHAALARFVNQELVETNKIGLNPIPTPSVNSNSKPIVLYIDNDDKIVPGSNVTGILQNAGASIQAQPVQTSVPIIVGGGETEQNGNYTFSFTVPSSTPPGIHFLKVYDKTKRVVLSTAAYYVNHDPSCKNSNNDIDGDSLPDACDIDPTDGPLGDADDDGIENGVDKCIVVKDSDQKDTNNDGVGDACDPAEGKNPMDGFRPLGWTPPNTAPVASISAPVAEIVGVAIDVNASSSADIDGTIVKYEWDFGDGTPKGASLSASHIYTKTGKYTIKLTIEDNLGAVSTTFHEITIIENIPSTFSIHGPVTGLKDTLLTYEATSSADVLDSLIKYNWDFGDGATESGKTTSHKYVQIGTYTLKLNAEDDKGSTYSASKDVTITDNKPPTAVINSTNSGHKGSPVTFSASQSADLDGLIASYEWDFGDNTAYGTDMDVNHVYKQNGTYTVKLKVKDNEQSFSSVSKSIVITTNQNPIPKIVSKTSVKKGNEISFDGSASRDTDGVIISYNWDFGDKTPNSNQVKPIHVYTKAGLYTVTLTVTDNDGGKKSIIQLMHIQEHKTPKAKVIIENDSIVGMELSFDASSSKDSDGTIVAYQWDFGDKTPKSNQVKPIHVYTKAGLYTVTLTVTDDDGLKNSAFRLLTLKDGKVLIPIIKVNSNVFVGKEILFDASLSKNPNGTIVLYQWDFGDKTPKSNQVKPIHVYTKAGLYKVSLTVTGIDGIKKSVSQLIHIQENKAPKKEK